MHTAASRSAGSIKGRGMSQRGGDRSLMRMAELARLFRVTPRTVQRRIQYGLLPPPIVGTKPPRVEAQRDQRRQQSRRGKPAALTEMDTPAQEAR